MRTKKIQAIHPGEVLNEEFLKPFSISKYRLAKDIAVPAIRIGQIVSAQRAISVDTALRLSKYFGTTPQFWLNLQMHYDLEKEADKIIIKINKEVRVFQMQTI